MNIRCFGIGIFTLNLLIDKSDNWFNVSLQILLSC